MKGVYSPTSLFYAHSSCLLADQDHTEKRVEHSVKRNDSKGWHPRKSELCVAWAWV